MILTSIIAFGLIAPAKFKTDVVYFIGYGVNLCRGTVTIDLRTSTSSLKTTASVKLPRISAVNSHSDQFLSLVDGSSLSILRIKPLKSVIRLSLTHPLESDCVQWYRDGARALIRANGKFMMFDGNSGKLKVIRAHKPGESVAVKNPWRPGLVNGKGIYLVHETKWYEEKPAHVPISGGSTLGGSYSSVITTWVGPKKKYSYELGTADTSSPTNKDGTWIMLSADGFFVVDNIRKSYQEVQGSKLDIQGMCMPYPWRVSP